MRQSVQVALFASLCAALGFLLAPIPNIELFTFGLFMAGYALGAGGGAKAAMLAVILYYGMNPYGSSLIFPPLFAAQLIAGVFISSLGALARRVLPPRAGRSWWRLPALLPFAALAALALPLLPSLAFAWVGGGSWEGWMALGLLMTAWGFVFNLLVFTAGFEPLARQMTRLDLGGEPHGG